MAKRTPEEIQAQREAFLAAKAARAAGLASPPAKPAEEPVAVAQSPVAEPAEAVQPAAAKRTPEEMKAQREAFLAAKVARAAGGAAPAVAQPAAAPAVEQPAVVSAAEVAKPKPQPREAAPAARPAPAKEAVDSTLTRREFLNYAWLASIALFSVQTVGLSLWFAFPNFRQGQFGGQFPIGAASGALPEVNAGPKAYVDGKFWLINVDTEVNGEPRQGILAIYKVCTHLGCLYEWVPMTNRFECPCHGSKFQLAGDYISGPARRSLDRFVIQAVAPDGSIKETDAEGHPLVISGDENLVIDTGRRILGQPVLVPA